MVRRRMRRAIVITACLALAGCGGKSASKSTQPNLGAKGTDTQAAQGLGFPSVATKNTTRVGGADPVANAAAVSQAVFPDSHPAAVTLPTRRLRPRSPGRRAGTRCRRDPGERKPASGCRPPSSNRSRSGPRIPWPSAG